jgi:hypothetical protein
MRTYVGWPARSVRSLRYHGTVLCLADSAPNFTTSRFSIAPPPCGTCYSAPNICSLLPEGCSHRTASATDGATALGIAGLPSSYHGDGNSRTPTSHGMTRARMIKISWPARAT